MEWKRRLVLWGYNKVHNFFVLHAGVDNCFVYQTHSFPAHTSYPVPSYSASPPQFHHRPVFHGMSSPSQSSHCLCLSCSHSGTFYPHPYGYQTPSPDHQGYQHYSQSFGHGIMSVRLFAFLLPHFSNIPKTKLLSNQKSLFLLPGQSTCREGLTQKAFCLKNNILVSYYS